VNADRVPALRRAFPEMNADRAWALIRVAAVPVVFAGERLVAHPTLRSAPFRPILIVAAVYAIGVLVVVYRRPSLRPPSPVLATLDFAFIGALAYTSGGPYSQLRYAFFLLPVGAGMLLRPTATALASAVSLGVYLIVALAYPTREAGDFELTQALYLAWMGGAAVLLSAELTRRSRRVEMLSEGRGRLIAQALDAEDRERRRLANVLHDEAIQNLLAIRYELADGNMQVVHTELERTVDHLRKAVFDLHPYVLDHAGLAAALESIAARTGSRSGLRWHVEVEPEAAGHHDRLLFGLVRELLANAERHARAQSVLIRVARRDRELLLEVVDDGVGLDAERLRAAPLEGHIGLASATERVEALDGKLEIASAPGRGTLVRARLPLAVPVA
jgi:two-component system NarL family sensor kinase